MKLTKTQISYLENKIDRVVSEKRNEFAKKMGDTSLDKEILKRLQSNKVKLLPKAEILSKFEEKIGKTSCYCTSLYIYELINKEDKEKIENEIKERKNMIDDYANKLYATKSNILDKIVLEGVNVETALAEFDKIS